MLKTCFLNLMTLILSSPCFPPATARGRSQDKLTSWRISSRTILSIDQDSFATVINPASHFHSIKLLRIRQIQAWMGESNRILFRCHGLHCH
ncbi:Dehydrodolichyl diphosphate synthase complex subunit nus1 [Fusarium oxysporum f. sp. albedinis]|nr:Dehydrodolichyl diphosphate synthase complex subunit nus1 [Fusarium oxysporum f. sp. albedinis]